MDGKVSQFDQIACEAMIANGFEPDFSADVRRQLDEITGKAADAAKGVKDLRSLLWSSIDNASSRDLDQIEWAEQLDNGDIRVLVGIADVDALIGKDTAIDRHAAINTVTVYTPTEVFPMLPEVLSTDLTSLNENEDRLAVIADMVVKADGDVPDSTFYPALVRNQAKLAYESLGPWLDERGPMPEKVSANADLEQQLRLQNEAAQRLQHYRTLKGALQFESIESAAVIENGDVKGIVSVEPNGARELIENLMVAANVEMAEFLENRHTASLRRVVRTPRQWDGIVRIAAEFGFKLPPEPDQPSLARFLAERRAADLEHFPDLSLSIIKLIGSGEYVVQADGEDAGGHFGLAVNDYAHSTAPNRRYTDMVVQRLVKAVLRNEPPPYSVEELRSIADHANKQEKNARKVERKMRKVIAAGVMSRHIGETFDAIVTGDTSAGVFARILRPPVDGRIIHGQERVRVGDKIRVKLLSANPHNGFIDFAVR